jgi:hypothetical protein
MKKETRGIITLLIRESQEIIAIHEDKYRTKEELVVALNKLFDGWIKANDLHPERCVLIDNVCGIDKERI